MQIRLCAREFKSDDRRLVCGASIGGTESNNTDRSEPQGNVFNHAHRRVTCVLPREGPETVLIRLPVEDRMGTDAGKVGLMKKSMYGTRDAASNWERDWQEHDKNWGFQLGLSSKNLFHHKDNQVSGLTHGDDFVLTGPTKKLMELRVCIQSMRRSSALGHRRASKR